MNNKSTKSINYTLYVPKVGAKFIFIKLFIDFGVNGDVKAFLSHPFQHIQISIWEQSTYLNFLCSDPAAQVLPTSQKQWKPRWNRLDLIAFASVNSFGKVSRAHHLEVMLVLVSQQRSMNSGRAYFSLSFHNFSAFLSFCLFYTAIFTIFTTNGRGNSIEFHYQSTISMPQFTFVPIWVFDNYFNLKSVTIKFENTIHWMEH